MLEKLFGFDRNVTRVRTEVLAGITTFLTMAYILAVNPNILSATGMDKGALFTTTVIASAFATIADQILPKLRRVRSVGVACGMNVAFDTRFFLLHCKRRPQSPPRVCRKARMPRNRAMYSRVLV